MDSDKTVTILGTVAFICILVCGVVAIWHDRGQKKCSMCNEFRECVPVCIECLRKTDKGSGAVE